MMSPEEVMPWMTPVRARSDVSDLDLSCYQRRPAGEDPPSGRVVFPH